MRSVKNEARAEVIEILFLGVRGYLEQQNTDSGKYDDPFPVERRPGLAIVFSS